MTKFTDHIHSEILNIAEKNLNSDQVSLTIILIIF